MLLSRSFWLILALLAPLSLRTGASHGQAVDEITGEAVYTVPIVTPPGTAGTGPVLALEYRSGEARGGAGWLGFGWRLRGVGAVERDLSHGVPFEYESLQSCGTALCYRDDFTLDGEDLVCADSPCSGAYRLQRDDGHRIAFLGEAAGWEIQDRDGTRSFYGTDPGSRIVNERNGQVFSWLLARVEDVSGNWIDYAYDISLGVAVPTRIEYAQAGAAANRSVLFRTEPRGDRFVSYRAGFRQETARNVVEIEVRAAQDALVTSYTLSYASSPDSGRSLLTAVRRVGSDGATSLPPQRFTYSESLGGFDTTPTSFCGGTCALTDLWSGGAFPDVSLADMNRDGLPDAYDAATGPDTNAGLHNGVWIPPPWASSTPWLEGAEARFVDGDELEPIEVRSLVLDLDGDRFPDWLHTVGTGHEALTGSADGYVPVPTAALLPTGPGLVTNGSLSWALVGLQPRSRNSTDPLRYEEYLNGTLTDLTGDGLPDRVYAKYVDSSWAAGSGSSDHWRVHPGLGWSADGSSLSWSTAYLEWPDPLGEPIESYEVYLAARYFRTLMLDWNADGLPDRVTRSSSAGTTNFEVAYNNGAGFEPPEVVLSLPMADFHSRSIWTGCSTHEFADLNGDGFLDHVVAAAGINATLAQNQQFVGLPSDGWNVRFGSGGALQSQLASWGGTGELAPLGGLRSHQACVRGEGTLTGFKGGLADLDGDGLLDRYGGWFSEVYANLGPVPDLLLRAELPAGGTAEFRYAGSAQMRDLELSDYGCEASPCDTTPLCNAGECSVTRDPCQSDVDCGVCSGGLADGNACMEDSQCVACTGTPIPASPDLAPTRPVVSELALSDGRAGAPVVSRYHWAVGQFDYEERELRGFGVVTRTDVDPSDPVGGTEVVSRYRTDRECAGRLAAREVWHGDELLQSVSLSYETHSGPSGLPVQQTWTACLLTARTEVAVEGASAVPRIRSVEWEHGPDPVATYYNVLSVHELGEVDREGTNLSSSDDRHTYYGYALPTTPDSHVVSRLTEVSVWADPLASAPLSHTRLYYDTDLPLGQVALGRLTRIAKLHHDPQADPPVEDAWVETRIGYDSYGHVVSRRGPPTDADPNGFAISLSYDPIYQTFPTVHTRGFDTATPLSTSFAYEGCSGDGPPPALGLRCQVTDPRGRSNRFAYDALGRVVAVEHGSGLMETRSYTPPDPGEPVQSSETVTLRADDAESLVFERISDGLGRLFLERSPGKVGEVIETVRSYDAAGRLATETIPHFRGTASPLQRVFEYDPLGRPRSLVDFDGTTTTVWTYEPWRLIEEVYFTSPNPADRQSRTERSFDGRDRIEEVAVYEDPVALAGRLAVTAQYDALDRLVVLTDPIGNDPGLCEPGAPCESQDHTTELFYDTLGRRVRIDDPDSGSWRFRFDPAGLLTERRDGSGRMQSFEYDELQRPTWRRFSPAGAGSADAQLRYQDDPAQPGYGLLAAIDAEGSGTDYEYAYDSRGRVRLEQQTTLGQRFVNRYRYDRLGRIRRRTFPDGESFIYVYDGLRLERIEGASLRLEYPLDILMGAQYDAFGRTVELRLGDTLLIGESPAATLSRSYDEATARLERVQAEGRFGSELDLSLEFDGLGRLVALDGSQAATPLSSRSFEYDGLGRLSRAIGPWEQPDGNGEVVAWSYAYDPLGNLIRQSSSSGIYERSFGHSDPLRPRFLTDFAESTGLSETHVADGGGRPVAINGEPLVWNAQGRLHQAAGSASRYAYDALDRRTVHEIPGDTSIVYVGNDFEYDSTLQQANKFFFVNGERVASRATFYRAEQARAWPVLLTPVAGALLLLALLGLVVAGPYPRAPALAAPGIGLLVLGLVLLPWSRARAIIGLGGGPSWHGSHAEGLLIYAGDHLGSTRVVIDATGQSVESRDYAPFGATISHQGPFALQHRFTGQRYDDTTGLHDYGARMYHARRARFLSPDERIQSLDAQGLDPYAYVRNTPTSLIDSSGNIAQLPPALAVALVTGTAAVWLDFAQNTGAVPRGGVADVVKAGLVTSAVYSTALGLPPAAPLVAHYLAFSGVGFSLASLLLAIAEAFGASEESARPEQSSRSLDVQVEVVSTGVSDGPFAFAPAGVSEIEASRSTSSESPVARARSSGNGTIVYEHADGSTSAAFSQRSATVARQRAPRSGGRGGPTGHNDARATALFYYHTNIWLAVSGL